MPIYWTMQNNPIRNGKIVIQIDIVMNCVSPRVFHKTHRETIELPQGGQILFTTVDEAHGYAEKFMIPQELQHLKRVYE